MSKMSINETNKERDNYDSFRTDIIRNMYLAVAVLFAVSTAVVYFEVMILLSLLILVLLKLHM